MSAAVAILLTITVIAVVVFAFYFLFGLAITSGDVKESLIAALFGLGASAAVGLALVGLLTLLDAIWAAVPA